MHDATILGFVLDEGTKNDAHYSMEVLILHPSASFSTRARKAMPIIRWRY
jgi:hypothetical protein